MSLAKLITTILFATSISSYLKVARLLSVCDILLNNMFINTARSSRYAMHFFTTILSRFRNACFEWNWICSDVSVRLGRGRMWSIKIWRFTCRYTLSSYYTSSNRKTCTTAYCSYSFIVLSEISSWWFRPVPRASSGSRYHRIPLDG